MKAINQYSYETIKGITLTKRQIRLFRLIAQGYSVKQVASLQNTGLRTTHNAISSAIRRNKANSVHNLIYLMAKKNII